MGPRQLGTGAQLYLAQFAQNQNCMILHFIVWYSMKLYGILCYCMELHCWLWRTGCISQDSVLKTQIYFTSLASKCDRLKKNKLNFWNFLTVFQLPQLLGHLHLVLDQLDVSLVQWQSTLCAVLFS